MALNVPNDLFYRSTSPLDLNYRTSTSAQLTPYQTPGLVSPLSSSGIVGYNVPAPAAPAPAPTPQPQNNNSGGGGNGFDMKYYPGWGEAEARADWAATGGSKANQGGGGQPDYSAEINSIYNPLFQSLTDQGNYIQNTQLPQSLSQLEVSRAQLEEDLAAKQAQSQQSITSQKEILGQKQLSAMDEAKRAHQALTQQSQARFGGRGSAGMAATEIASKEYARAQGNVQRGFTEAYAKLVDFGNQVDMFGLSESRRIAREVELQKQQIQAEAQNRLYAISRDKNQLESQKAAAKLDLIRESQARINALEDQRTTALLELSTWKNQMDYTLEAQFKQVQQSAPQTNYGEIFSAPTFTQAPAQSYQPQYISQGNRPDELNNLINPFA
ncbi:hypothetical protein HYW42_05675 [Candidatus Daviesbacteria bacterium]|nr:hypothetical protein [Candidatus Daviesbacteria bacterium]